MGRRSLPKVDRSIPIDQHFFELEDLAPPLDPDWYTGRSNLEIEIGCGKGLFLLNQSASHPDHLFVGIEIARKYARFAAYRLSKHNRENAKIIRGDGLKFVHDFLADESVSDVHVYFPDPWWKEKHRRRRVMQVDFLTDVQRVLTPSGRLHFWTDVQEYFESTCELINQCTQLKGPVAVDVAPAEHDMDYRTHFERRMRINDHDVFRSQFTRS